MIAIWMFYAAVVGILVGAAALAGERAARAFRLPVRMVWVLACALTLLGPVLSYLTVARRPTTLLVAIDRGTLPSPQSADGGTRTSARAGIAALEATLTPALRLVAADLAGPLLVVWGVASLLLLTGLGASVARLRARRKTWATLDVDGTTVLISPDVGPAVVGLRSMDIVMPEWSLALDAPLRAIVLRHESEHRRVGDPYLLFMAALACALVPWNLALWWQVRRLRLAVEIDCDGRVLRDDPCVDRYGTLLLAIAQRTSAHIPAAIAALTESPSDLERRIDAMTNPSRHSRLIALSCVGAAIGALCLALEAPVPAAQAAEVTYRVPTPAPVSGLSSATAAATRPQGAPLTTANPRPKPSLAGSTGIATVGAVVDTNILATGDSTDDHAIQRATTNVGGDTVYYPFQVERQVAAVRGNTPPTYPPTLHAAAIEGEVLVSFVVDTTGFADMSTFKVIKTTHDLFTDAVRDCLPEMRFIPAKLHGAKVKQIVQQAFLFTMKGL